MDLKAGGAHGCGRKADLLPQANKHPREQQRLEDDEVREVWLPMSLSWGWEKFASVS